MTERKEVWRSTRIGEMEEKNHALENFFIRLNTLNQTFAVTDRYLPECFSFTDNFVKYKKLVLCTGEKRFTVVFSTDRDLLKISDETDGKERTMAFKGTENIFTAQVKTTLSREEQNTFMDEAAGAYVDIKLTRKLLSEINPTIDPFNEHFPRVFFNKFIFQS